MRIRQFDSQTAFAEHGGRLPFDIPQTAQDCRFAMRHVPFGRLYLCAFRLDEAECSAYLDALRAQYKLDSEDESDRAYSYAHWYRMQVSDCVSGDPTEDFPVHLPFDAVTEREIGEATVIVYSPVSTGSRSSGLVLFPDTGEIVCFLHLTR